MKNRLATFAFAALAFLHAMPADAAEPAEDFSQAIDRNDSVRVKALLAQDPKLAGGTNIVGRTWLGIAVERVQLQLVTELLAAKPDVNAVTLGGNTALLSAIPSELDQPVPAARFNTTYDDEGNATTARQPLTAAEKQRLEREANRESIVKLLAASGANPFATNSSKPGETPFSRAVEFRRTNLLDAILFYSTRVAERDANGEPLVHLAIQLRRFQALPLLGANRADLAATNRAGLTPMQALVLASAPPIIAHKVAEPDEPPGFFLLLAAGAKPDPFSLAGLGKLAEVTELVTSNPALMTARDAQGRTLLHWAALKGHSPVVAFLLARGGKPAAADQAQRLALHEAAERGYAPIVDALLADPSTLNARDTAGRSALELAAAGGHESVLAALLKLKPELEPARAGQSAALHRAADSGNPKAVALLLDAGAKVNSRDAHRQTPLHRAAAGKEPKIVAQLLAVGAEVDAADEQGDTPLRLAAGLGLPVVVEALLTKAPQINHANARGQTALDAAVAGNYDQAAVLLIARGARVSTTTNGMNTPLHVAARAGNERLTQLLLAIGTDVNATNETGATPFILAMANSQIQVADRLLAAGADVNARDKNGRTALAQANFAANFNFDGEPAEEESLAVVRVRLQREFRGWIQMLDPQSPILQQTPRFQLARIRAIMPAGAALPATPAKQSTSWREFAVNELAWLAGMFRLDLSLQADQMAWQRWRSNPWKYLLAVGADARVTNALGQTPLHLLAQAQYWDGMPTSGIEGPFKQLVQNGADLNARDTEGRTPLHLAAAASNTLLIDLLLRAKADPNPTNKLGQTPLHLVVTTYNSMPAEKLLTGGANPNIQDKDGNTPLHLAAANSSQREILRAMMKAKADRHLRNKQGKSAFEIAQSAGVSIDAFNPAGAEYGIVEAARRGDMATVKLFLADDPRFANSTGPVGGNIRPLHWAAQLGNLELIKLLLESGADVNGRSGKTNAENTDSTTVSTTTTTTTTASGQMTSRSSSSSQASSVITPLQYAVTAGQREAAKLLMEKGAEVDPHCAASLGLIEQLAKLHKEAPERLKESVSRGTMLFTSFTNGWSFNPNHDPRGGTPLHFALYADQRAAAEWLLEHGADGRAADPLGHTPLFHALKSGRKELADLIERNGGTLDIFTAISLGKTNRVAELLRESPALVAATNMFRVPPLAWAVIEGQLECTALLLASNAPVNAGLMNRIPGIVAEAADAKLAPTVLHLAAARNGTNIGALLITRGADVKVMDDNGYTPLHHAVLQGAESFARLLLSNKAPVDAQLLVTNTAGRTSFSVPSGNTPLHLAALYGRTNLAELLIARGAKVEATNRFGATPMANAKFGRMYGTYSSPALPGPGLPTPGWRVPNREMMDLLGRHGAVEPASPPRYNTTANAAPAGDIPAAARAVAPAIRLLPRIAPLPAKAEPAKKDP